MEDLLRDRCGTSSPANVHVWLISLTICDVDLARLAQVLDDEERRRANAYRLTDCRRRFIAARGFLREVLRSYQLVSPRDVRFRYGPKGKPVLDNDTELQFNLSHSGVVASIAVTQGRRLGIDVEVIRHDLDFLGLAHRFFSPSEAARIEQARDSERALAFFAHWTCKEAYLKASGDGLSLYLDRFAVVASLDHAHVELETEDEGSRSRWSVRRLQLADGLAAAIAVEGDGWKLSSACWPPLRGEQEFG